MAKTRMSKEEYDKLYYYVSGEAMSSIRKGQSPLKHAGPRRYDAINDCRKAALNRSRANWRRNKEYMEMGFGTREHIDIHVFKGTRHIGVVEYGDIPLWYPDEHPKDPTVLRKDGSIN